jgi:hypothetical protein
MRFPSTQRAFLVALALASTMASLAPAASAQQDPEPLLWATVNICDTDDHPDTIGIRGSMPGTGRRSDRLFMRFQVQFQASDGTWRPLSTGGLSDWEAVGRGHWESRQSGWSFRLSVPEGTVRLRGVVRFEWRRRGRAVRREVRATEAGHRSTAGADPPRYSRATCTVRS